MFSTILNPDTIQIWNLAGELLNVWTTQKVSFEIDIMFTFLIRDKKMKCQTYTRQRVLSETAFPEMWTSCLDVSASQIFKIFPSKSPQDYC